MQSDTVGFLIVVVETGGVDSITVAVEAVEDKVVAAA